MTRKLALGILGTGNIAKQFAQGVQSSARCTLVGVGSRSLESAQNFARTFKLPQAYGSYQALLADPAVEAVYISLPNDLHHAWSIKALQAGKHVLCEKPLAMDQMQALEMYAAAQQAGKVLIEAFMYLCHPLTQAWLEKIRAGAIGNVKFIRAGFCYFASKEEGNVRFNRAGGGGVLMDVGCYCLSLARLLGGGDPVYLEAVAEFHPEHQVDILTIGTLRFASGVMASFHCGMKAHADNTLMISGDKGCLLVPIPWKPPEKGASFTLTQSIPPKMDGGTSPPPPGPQTFTLDAGKPVYGLEADAFADCVLDGAAPFVTMEQSLGHLRMLDALRGKIGLHW